jgi:hypothetical protein
MCLAIRYYGSIGSRRDATSADFADWVAGQVDRTPRHRAEEVYDHSKGLSQGDLSNLTDLYCDAP